MNNYVFELFLIMHEKLYNAPINIFGETSNYNDMMVKQCAVNLVELYQISSSDVINF